MVVVLGCWGGQAAYACKDVGVGGGRCGSGREGGVLVVGGRVCAEGCVCTSLGVHRRVCLHPPPPPHPSPDLQQHKVLLAGVVQHLPSRLPPPAPREADHLAQQAEVRLVGDQAAGEGGGGLAMGVGRGCGAGWGGGAGGGARAGGGAGGMQARSLGWRGGAARLGRVRSSGSLALVRRPARPQPPPTLPTPTHLSMMRSASSPYRQCRMLGA